MFRGNAFFGPVGHLRALGHLTHQHARANRHAFGLQLFSAAVDVRFFHLEVWNAVAQQTANAVVFLKQSDVVTDARKLLCSGHAGRARPHHGHFFARLVFRQLRCDPSFRPSTVNDGVLDRLDAHCVVVVVQGASSFAWCRANASGELRKVIRAVQHIDRRFPISLVNQVIEVRNDVVDRAAAITKRRAAIHATRALVFGLFVIQNNNKLFVIFQTLGDRLIALFDALKLHESGNFSHDGFPLLGSSHSFLSLGWYVGFSCFGGVNFT